MMTRAKPHAEANRAFDWVLWGGILAWVLFVVSRVADLAFEAGRAPGELWGPESVVAVWPSIYLVLAAIAAVTLGGLLGRRRLARVAAGAEPRLVRAVQRFATTVTIIGLVLAAIAAIVVFTSNLWSSGDTDTVVARVLNSYLPIALYTALVIVVILAAFVFARPAVFPPTETVAAEPPTAESPAAPQAAAQCATALAYTLPIVAVAVALIFGLIVYDLTQTALEAWIWVIVQVLVSVGIIAGTAYAARAVRTQRRAGTKPAGAGIGATRLNLVLSIVFAASVTAMSLGYGSSAADQLRVQSSLGVNAYPDSTIGTDAGSQPEDVVANLNGYDLGRGTEAALSLEPGGEVLATEQVDRHGAVWAEARLPAGIAAGDYEISARAETPDGRELSASFPVVVTDEGLVRLPEMPDASSGDDATRVVSPTVGWVLGDLAPAAVLLLLVVITLRTTVNSRNRE